MALINVAIPVIQAAVELLKSRRDDVAEKAGVQKDAVDRISGVISDYLGKDEKLLALTSDEIEKARQHDVSTLDKSERVVNLLRGLVRPVVTFTAFVWYVFARAAEIPLGSEDYAIIGGVIAFWFGFRPFDKKIGK